MYDTDSNARQICRKWNLWRVLGPVSKMQIWHPFVFSRRHVVPVHDGKCRYFIGGIYHLLLHAKINYSSFVGICRECKLEYKSAGVGMFHLTICSSRFRPTTYGCYCKLNATITFQPVRSTTLGIMFMALGADMMPDWDVFCGSHQDARIVRNGLRHLQQYPPQRKRRRFGEAKSKCKM